VAGRIARLLGRKAPDPPELADALARLAKLAEGRPELEAGAARQAGLLRAAFGTPPAVDTVQISPAEAASRLDGGLPLLRGHAPPLPSDQLRERFLRLCAAAGERGGVAAGPAEALAAAVRSGTLDPWDLARALLAGEGASLPGRIEERGLPGDVALTLLRLALLPALAEVTKQLQPLLAARPWRRGYCPVCGAWPTLAEQRGLEQLRHMRCGLCAASWEVDRLFCPACENRDHTRLGYLQVEGEERERVATCDVCGSYWKVRNALAPLSPPLLVVEELALIHLDIIALDNGFAPPS
jgi:FdhE protein